MKKLCALLFVLATPSFAADMTVSDQDQAAIFEICQMAAKSPAADIYNTAGVATWCVQWRNRMKEAAAKVAEPKDKAEPVKP